MLQAIPDPLYVVPSRSPSDLSSSPGNMTRKHHLRRIAKLIRTQQNSLPLPTRSLLEELLALGSLVGGVGGDATGNEDTIRGSAETGGARVGRGGGSLCRSLGRRVARQSLQGTNEELLKGLAGLVAVADILESLCRILAGDVEHDLLATRVLVDELAAVIDLVVDNEEAVLLGVVLGNILVGVLLGGHFDGVGVGFLDKRVVAGKVEG